MTNFTNGGFETGDFTGWSTSLVGVSPYVVGVRSSYPHSGTYDAQYDIDASSDPLYPDMSSRFTISQTLDFSKAKEISFELRVVTFGESTPTGDTYFSVDITTASATYTMFSTTQSVSSQYENIILNVATLRSPASCTVSFSWYCHQGGVMDSGYSKLRAFLDDCTFIEIPDPTDVDVVGAFDILGLTHDVDMQGKFDVDGISHAVPITALFDASHSKISTFRCEID